MYHLTLLWLAPSTAAYLVAGGHILNRSIMVGP
jgi:hypothetical protein